MVIHEVLLSILSSPACPEFLTVPCHTMQKEVFVRMFGKDVCIGRGQESWKHAREGERIMAKRERAEGDKERPNV